MLHINSMEKAYKLHHEYMANARQIELFGKRHSTSFKMTGEEKVYHYIDGVAIETNISNKIIMQALLKQRRELKAELRGLGVQV